MKPAFSCQRYVVAALCFFCLAGCESAEIALSPPMHARVVDGVTGKPLNDVQVTLVSAEVTNSLTAYSDRKGLVVLPGMMAPDHPVQRVLSETLPTAVQAVFRRPGYQTYTIDSVNGYGFFRGDIAVRLFPE